MSTGIMIIGPSGSGKTTLGKIVAQKLGYLYFDVDDYIWKQNTDSPYTQMYTREEKISRLNTDIAPYEHRCSALSKHSHGAESSAPFWGLRVSESTALHTGAAASVP